MAVSLTRRFPLYAIVLVGLVLAGVLLASDF